MATKTENKTAPKWGDRHVAHCLVCGSLTVSKRQQSRASYSPHQNHCCWRETQKHNSPVNGTHLCLRMKLLKCFRIAQHSIWIDTEASRYKEVCWFEMCRMCCADFMDLIHGSNLKQYSNVFYSTIMLVHPNCFWLKTKPGLGTAAVMFAVWIKELVVSIWTKWMCSLMWPDRFWYKSLSPNRS